MRMSASDSSVQTRSKHGNATKDPASCIMQLFDIFDDSGIIHDSSFIHVFFNKIHEV